MNLTTINSFQRRGALLILIGVVLRLISGQTAFGDVMNFVILFGVIHLSIDLYERRHQVAAVEIEQGELFQVFLDEDEVRGEMSPDDARAAFIAWRDSRHYGS